jgi:UDP:flavonoid glycosyltransferase YjiC (YdhE family)
MNDALVEYQLGYGVRSGCDSTLEWLVSPYANALLLDSFIFGVGENFGDLGIGYPYTDVLSDLSEPTNKVLAWIESSNRPLVVITAGSFLSWAAPWFWELARRSVTGLGARVLLLNVPQSMRCETPEVLATGFRPLSALLEHADLIVQHGGIGVTYAALRAGTPSVIVPIAFDQARTGSHIHRLGAGIVVNERTASAVRRAITSVWDDRRRYAERARVAVGELIPSDSAVASLVALVERATGSTG